MQILLLVVTFIVSGLLMYKLRNKRFMTAKPWMPFVANGLIFVATSVVLQFALSAGIGLYNSSSHSTYTSSGSSTPAMRTATPADTTPAMRAATPADTTPSIRAAAPQKGFQPDATQIAIGAVGMLVIIGIFVSIRRTREEQKRKGLYGEYGQPNAMMYHPGMLPMPIPTGTTSSAKENKQKAPGTITFEDVAGCDEAKEELMEVVEFLRDPSHFLSFGAKVPKGTLMVGPPGNGKTLLAKAVAFEAGAAFFSASGSEFVEKYVGVGASRVRELFEKAKKAGRAVIFIDEIDSIGRRRGQDGGGNSEWETTLNELLVQMDGFAADNNIIIIAATNRVDILDPALLRPGRFDRQVLVDLPDLNGREAILKVHTKGKPLAEGLDLKLLAKRTPGFSGAEIAGACNEAAIVAARRTPRKNSLCPKNLIAALTVGGGDRVITLEDFDEGIDRVKLGIARPGRAKIMSGKEMENTAWHEIGHGIITHLLGDPVSKITIMPRARALGYMQPAPKESSFSITDEQLKVRIMVAMAGRLTQELFLQTVDTGASNDFMQASDIAFRMVTEWGMSEEVGFRSLNYSGGSPFRSGGGGGGSQGMGPDLLNKVDSAIERILAECKTKTIELLKENEARIRRIVPVLLEKETILAPEWEALFNDEPVAQPLLLTDGTKQERADDENGQLALA